MWCFSNSYNYCKWLFINFCLSLIWSDWYQTWKLSARVDRSAVFGALHHINHQSINWLIDWWINFTSYRYLLHLYFYTGGYESTASQVAIAQFLGFLTVKFFHQKHVQKYPKTGWTSARSSSCFEKKYRRFKIGGIFLLLNSLVPAAADFLTICTQTQCSKSSWFAKFSSFVQGKVL